MCEPKEFDLPLGLGKVSWEGLTCPVAAGELSVAVGVQLAAVIPASVATADVTATATGASADDKLLCMTLHTQAQKQAVDCSGAACPSICECANSQCSSAVDACLADSACAAAQGCVLACSCGDTACAAACAAGAGSAATDVLGCLTSSCGGDSTFV